MRTSKPISTISYNTYDYLKERLEEMIENHIISDWMFIYHYAEEDETKDHFHVWMYPNKLLDTMDLQSSLREYDPDNLDAPPLGCINFHSSDIDEWILYVQHYIPYLESKGQIRKFSYTKEDFYFHDENEFDRNHRHAFYESSWARKYQTLEVIRDGLNNPDFDAVSLILKGIIPFSQASQLNSLMSMKYKYGTTFRNGKKGHQEISNEIKETDPGYQERIESVKHFQSILDQEAKLKEEEFLVLDDNVELPW